jgi:esterase/lipase superfamily enzyme
VSVTVDKRNRCLLVSGHVSATPARSVTIELSSRQPTTTTTTTPTTTTTTTTTTPALQLDKQWRAQSSDEALLFIHGVDHTTKDACKRMAQFLALGQFPAHIKPFVFSWPSSQNFLYYFCAANLASDSNVHYCLLFVLITCCW